MTPFIQLESTFFTEPRVFELAAELGVHVHYARGLLATLWDVCRAHGPELPARSTAALAALLQYDGDADLLAALKSCGWVRVVSGQVCVQGWSDRYGRLEARRRRDRERKAAERARMSDGRPADVTRNSTPKKEERRRKKEEGEEEASASAEQPQSALLPASPPSESSGPSLDARIFLAKGSRELQLTRVQVHRLEAAFGADFVDRKLTALAAWTERNAARRKVFRRRDDLFRWVKARLAQDHAEQRGAGSPAPLHAVPADLPDWTPPEWASGEDDAA